MATAKVTINGNTILDLTDATASASEVLSTYTAYGSDGSKITGQAVVSPTLQSKTKTYTPTTSQQTETVTADNGYDGLDEVSITVNAMPTGTAGTPTATKGTVSNHSVSVTPSVTNTTGYITGSTKTGTAVTVSASELVSGNKAISANGNNIDVTDYATVSVAVPTSTAMNFQIDNQYKQRTANSYGDTGLTLTVAVTGTYTVTWVAWRGSSSGTMGTNLHVNDTTGTNQQTFTGTYGQLITLTNQHYNKNDVLRLYATSGSTSRSIYVANLTIIQTS